MRLMHRMISELRITPAVVGLSAAAGVSVLTLFLFDPAYYNFYPACYFHLITGLYCPGCGALRATHQLLHGHFVAAARLNLLLVLCVPAGALWSVRSIRPLWGWMLLASCVVFSVARNLPGYEWLSP
jgi:hypothetical protein